MTPKQRFAAAALVLSVTMLLTGCTRDIRGAAVAASGDSQCATVTAPLADIPSVDDGEPQLRIPIPAGWKRNSMMDSRIIRYAIVAEDLVEAGFAPNAVVTLESVRGVQAAEEVFEQNRSNLITMMGASDLTTESNLTCGFYSETTDYTAPPMGPAPERPIIMHAVVADIEATTYLVTITIQASDGANPTYQRDAQEIIDGFQVLSPDE